MHLLMAAVFRLWIVLIPFTASALGLGDIKLDSALNQPFLAEIPLESVDASELTDLQVTLADAATFERYGLDRPEFLQAFQFSVKTDANGRSFIILTSPRPVVEPFISMLLDVKWESGRLLREYTVLLDPPLFEEQPVRQAVTPVKSAPVTTPRAEARPVAAPVIPTSLEASDYLIQRGDTLWSIVERVRINTGISNNQMMLALYRSNPAAFLGNINRLKAGAILRIPRAADVSGVSPLEATVEVRQQHVTFNAGTGVAEEPRLELVASGDGIASGTDSASAAVDSDVVARAAQTDRLQNQIGDLEVALDESQRLLQLRDAELQALQQRIAELEQRGAETLPEDAEFAEDGDLLADSGDIFADEAEVADEEAVAAPNTGIEELQSEPEDATTVVTRPDEEPSFLGGLLTNIWLWAGAAILLLLGLFIAKRRKDVEVGDDRDSRLDDPEAGADEDVSARPFVDLPATDDSIVVEEGTQDIFSGNTEEETDKVSTVALQEFDEDEPLGESTEEAVDEEVESPLEKTISTHAPLNLDEADPIAEAEFHMAYGLYDQAASLLTRALDVEPENRTYRVKLIEVFFVWEDKEGFLEQAQLLNESITDDTDSDWSKVLILGRQLCPDEELFADGAMVAPTADSMDLALTDSGETEIDITLDGTDVQIPDVEAYESDDVTLDVDLGTGIFGDADESEDDVESTLESLIVDFDPDDEDSASTMETPAIENQMNESTLESEGPEGDTSEMPELDVSVLEDDEDDAITLSSPDDLPDDIDFAFEGVGERASDGDTIEQPQLANPDGDTAEQPTVLADVDTNDSEEESTGADEPAMTEIGTKLELARAYIEMDDPEGARSILNEVLNDGGDAQQQEARQLLAELSD